MQATVAVGIEVHSHPESEQSILLELSLLEMRDNRTPYVGENVFILYSVASAAGRHRLSDKTMSTISWPERSLNLSSTTVQYFYFNFKSSFHNTTRRSHFPGIGRVDFYTIYFPNRKSFYSAEKVEIMKMLF